MKGPLHRIPIGKASLCTTDAQIAALERLIEAGSVEQIITVCLLKDIAPGLAPVQVMPMGATPERTRDLLQIALDGLCETLGMAKPAPMPTEK
jgi:hypothetical protein